MGRLKSAGTGCLIVIVFATGGFIGCWQTLECVPFAGNHPRPPNDPWRAWPDNVSPKPPPWPLLDLPVGWLEGTSTDPLLVGCHREQAPEARPDCAPTSAGVDCERWRVSSYRKSNSTAGSWKRRLGSTISTCIGTVTCS